MDRGLAFRCIKKTHFPTKSESPVTPRATPPRALTRTSVNLRRRVPRAPVEAPLWRTSRRTAWTANVHIRAHTRAVRSFHAAHVAGPRERTPPRRSPRSVSALGRAPPRHEKRAIAHCLRRSIRRPTSPPTRPPRAEPQRPAPRAEEREGPEQHSRRERRRGRPKGGTRRTSSPTSPPPPCRRRRARGAFPEVFHPRPRVLVLVLRELPRDVPDERVGSHDDHHLARKASAELVLTWSMVIGGLPPRMIPSTRAAASGAPRVRHVRPAASRSFVVPIGATCDVWRAAELRQHPAEALGNAHLHAHRAHERGVAHRHRVPHPAHAATLGFGELRVQPVVQQHDLRGADARAAAPEAEEKKVEGRREDRDERVQGGRDRVRESEDGAEEDGSSVTAPVDVRAEIAIAPRSREEAMYIIRPAEAFGRARSPGAGPRARTRGRAASARRRPRGRRRRLAGRGPRRGAPVRVRLDPADVLHRQHLGARQRPVHARGDHPRVVRERPPRALAAPPLPREVELARQALLELGDEEREVEEGEGQERERVMKRIVARSASNCRRRPGRCTFTATSSPDAVTARCTCASEAAATGSRSNAAKRRGES